MQVNEKCSWHLLSNHCYEAAENLNSNWDYSDPVQDVHECTWLLLSSMSSSESVNWFLICFISNSFSLNWESSTSWCLSHCSPSPDETEDDPEKLSTSESASKKTSEDVGDTHESNASKDHENWNGNAWGDAHPESPKEPSNIDGVDIDCLSSEWWSHCSGSSKSFCLSSWTNF